MKCSLGISNFLEEISSVSNSIIFLYFFALITEVGFFISLLLFFGTLHPDGCNFKSSPLPFSSLLLSAICKASSDNQLGFLHFFFGGMVLIIASCRMSWTSIHSSSATLSELIPGIYLSLPLCSHKGFDLGHTGMVFLLFPTFLNLILNLSIRSSWSEPQSAPGLVFVDCIELLHLWLQKI